MEIKESEHRAHMQAEILRSALDEHSLELRVRAANEAELACQKRLSAAEAEIADIKEKLDASERLLTSFTNLKFLAQFHITCWKLKLCLLASHSLPLYLIFASLDCLTIIILGSCLAIVNFCI